MRGKRKIRLEVYSARKGEKHNINALVGTRAHKRTRTLWFGGHMGVELCLSGYELKVEHARERTTLAHHMLCWIAFTQPTLAHVQYKGGLFITRRCKFKPASS